MTFFGEYYFTNFGEYIFENLSKSLKLSQILVTKFLKISLIQQNFHQFWWKNMCKIINKYCHRFRWNFHHLITHYFLWFTKKITRIGENSAKNSSENQDGLLPRWNAIWQNAVWTCSIFVWGFPNWFWPCCCNIKLSHQNAINLDMWKLRLKVHEKLSRWINLVFRSNQILKM